MFNRIYAIIMRQVMLLRRSPGRWTGLVYWPMIDLFVWGTLSVYLNRSQSSPSVFVYLIGSVIMMNFIWRTQQGIGVSFLEDVWTHNFVNLFASPLTLTEYLIGLTITALVKIAIAIGFMSLVAFALYAFSIFTFSWYLLPFIAILFLFSIALGFFSVGLTLRIGPSAEALVWSIPAIISPLSGAMYPVTTLPAWIQHIAWILPPTYVFEGMRQVLAGHGFHTAPILTALAGSLIALALGLWYVYQSYRSVLKRGLFSRFSATD